MHKIKKYEDKGSPCRMPLDGQNSSKAPSIMRMEIENVEMQLITKETRWLGNL